MADNGDPGGQELDGFQTLMESSMTSQRHDPDADFFEDDVSNLALTDIENNYLRNRETTEPRPNTDNINNSRVNPSQNRLPDNATLRSETSNSVILIKPLGPDVEKLINNPIALVPGLKVAQLVPIYLVHFAVGTGTLGQRSVRNLIERNESAPNRYQIRLKEMDRYQIGT